MEGKLEFYVKNSHVHPEFESSFHKNEILSLLENFNVLADKV